MIIIQCGEGHISILRRGPYVGEHGCTKSPMLFFVDLPSTPVPDAPSSILPGWNQTLNSYIRKYQLWSPTHHKFFPQCSALLLCPLYYL